MLAFEHAMQNKIDLFILSDIRDGDNPGYELAQKLRRTRLYEMAFIVLTSADQGKENQAYRAVKCYHYFAEPVEEDEFKEILSKLFKYRIKDSRNTYIKLDHNNKTNRLRLDNIVWVKIEEKNVIVYGKKGVLLIVGAHNYSLDDLEEMLGEEFMRIRQSIIVNKEYIHCVDYTNKLVHLSVSRRDVSDLVFKMGVTYIKRVREQWS